MDEGTKNYSFDHIFAGTNPSVLVDKTKSARDGLKTAHTDSGANEESKADDILLKVKLEDLSDILKDTRSAFFTPDFLTDEPIIVSDESEEKEEVSKDKDTKATSHDEPEDTSKEELEQAKAKAEVAAMKAKTSYPDINQLTKLMGRRSDDVISNLKVNDLHSVEWREVIQAYPDKSEKGWKTIYDLIKTRLDQLTQTEQELKIDLNKPLKEQDPLNELNELANKKRKRTSDLKDHSSSTKKHKSSSSA
nr:hypothetical protein [Tanacetum cinerariifolium]